MLFRFLLWVLAWRINSLSRKHEGFQKVIRDYDHVVMQFRTADGKVKRYYQFDSGATSSRAGIHEDPTFAFVFPNAKSAMQLIKRMGDNPEDKTVFIYGIRDGDLKIEGDMAYLTWFQAIARYFGPEEK